MSERRRTSRLAGLLTILILMLGAFATVPSAGDPGADGPEVRPRVHAAPREVVRGMIDALEALLAEDPKRAKKALDRVAEASPPVMPEANEHLGQTVVSADAAFHKLLDLAREVANRGDNAYALRYHQGLQRTCLECHEYARNDGVFRTSGETDD